MITDPLVVGGLSRLYLCPILIVFIDLAGVLCLYCRGSGGGRTQGGEVPPAALHPMRKGNDGCLVCCCFVCTYPQKTMII
jgi:hypothetical protein